MKQGCSQDQHRNPAGCSAELPARQASSPSSFGLS